MSWLSLCDGFKILPFAVMQRVVRVRQRQLSYLFSGYCECRMTDLPL